MTTAAVSRRTLMAGAAAALVPMQQAVAQTAAAGGDWFAMIQAHHLAIAKTFDALLASPATGPKRAGLLRQLGYQLTAHSVAEENVIYPALALNGMTTESDKLYLDQAHAKVMNTETEMAAMKDKAGTAWLDKAKALQAAVLKHAKEDEEANLYPKLRDKLDASMNATLTALYKREFDSVKPVRA